MINSRNELRDMLASGVVSPEELQQYALQAPGDPAENSRVISNALAEVFQSQIPMGSMRNQSTGRMTYFQPNPRAPRTNADPGFSSTPYNDTQASYAGGQPSNMGQAQPPQSAGVKVYGVGDGTIMELGMEPEQTLPVDYTRAPITIPGVGKAHYTADGRYAVGTGSDGQPFKAVLGYDAAGSAALNAQALEREKTLQQIAASKASMQQAERPYYTPLPTPQGVFSFNSRSGDVKPVIGADGSPLVRSQDDPTLQGKIKGAETYTKGGAEQNLAQAEAAYAAVESIPKLDETLNLLRSGDTITGMGAEVMLNVERARSQFLSDQKAGKRVADTQVLDALLGSDVFPMIKALGIGARGLDTPAEREFLRQVMTGTTPMDKASLIRLTEIRRNVQARAVERFNARVERGELDEFFAYTGRQKERLGTAPQQAVPAQRSTNRPKPNARAVSEAKNDPAKAKDFIEFFGAEEAARYGIK